MGNLPSRTADSVPEEGTINIDHDPPAIVDQGLIDRIIQEARLDFQANHDLVCSALPIVNLVRLKTREPDETPSQSMRIVPGDSPYARFDNSISDSELCNSLFLMVSFQPQGELIQHCFLTSNRSYVLCSCSDQVLATVLCNSSSCDVDFTNMHFRYNHSTDDPETADLPTNCLLHPVCYPECSISYGENQQVAVGNGQQRLDIEQLCWFQLEACQ